MSPMELASMQFFASSRELVTITFNTSTTFVAPASTTRIETTYGQGAAGSPAVPASYATDSFTGAVMQYFHDSVASGTNSGNVGWFNHSQAAQAVRNAINSWASVSTLPASGLTEYIASQYRSPGGTQTFTEGYFGGQSTVYGGILAGSAILRADGPVGSTLSPVTGTSNYTAYLYVDYQYLVPGSGSAATTGASSSAFGLFFPGGVGGPASPVSQGSVTVTPGASYPINVAVGGFITITYYQ